MTGSRRRECNKIPIIYLWRSKESNFLIKSNGTGMGTCLSKLLKLFVYRTRKTLRIKRNQPAFLNRLIIFITDCETSARVLCAIVFPSAHRYEFQPPTAINWPDLVYANNVHSARILLDLPYIFRFVVRPFNRKSSVSDTPCFVWLNRLTNFCVPL